MGVIAAVEGARFDAIVVGRAGMDLYPAPAGTPTDQAQSMLTDMGGSAGNIAVALARHGAKVGLAAPVSADPVGDFVKRQLARFGITHLTPDPVGGDARTSLALAETIAEGSRTVIYRNNAADFALPPLPSDMLRASRALVVTGTALAAEPSRSACLQALQLARTRILDLDYRPYSWPDLETTRAVYGSAMEVADILVGNDEEFAQTAAPGQSGQDHAAARSHGALVIYKMGAQGARVVENGVWQELVPPYPVTALKPFGAGDAFLGGVLAILLEGGDIADALRFGAAAAALVVGRVGCANAMPDRTETEAFIASREERDA
ncbi:MAG: PfkB family carbohydrate kinase [Pseudomonadota bacterium]